MTLIKTISKAKTKIVLAREFLQNWKTKKLFFVEKRFKKRKGLLKNFKMRLTLKILMEWNTRPWTALIKKIPCKVWLISKTVYMTF